MVSETIGNSTLYLGDCREILPTLALIDVLITDPVWPNCPAGLLVGADDPYGLFRDFWEIMPPIKRAVIVMRRDSDPRFLQPVPLSFTCTSMLPYVIPGYIGRLLGGDELAYCFGEPIPRRAGQIVIPGRAPAVQPHGRRANGHPCSRSLSHFNWLVRWWSEPSETIIDPFMGSGTTALASLHHGRKFIGIEISPKYFDISCRRVEAMLAQGNLFQVVEQIPAHQEELL